MENLGDLANRCWESSRHGCCRMMSILVLGVAGMVEATVIVVNVSRNVSVRVPSGEIVPEVCPSAFDSRSMGLRDNQACSLSGAFPSPRVLCLRQDAVF